MSGIKHFQIETTYKALQLITSNLTELAVRAEILHDPTIDDEFNRLLAQAGNTLTAIDNALKEYEAQS